MQYMNIIFVCNEELKWGMQGYSLSLLDNQLTWLSSNCINSDVNVRAHLLRNNRIVGTLFRFEVGSFHNAHYGDLDSANGL